MRAYTKTAGSGVYFSGAIVKLPDSSSSAGRKVVVATVLVAVVLVLGVVLPSRFLSLGTALPATAPAGPTRYPAPPGTAALARLRAHAGRKLTAEQVVATKLTRFAKKHRALVHRIADHYHLAVPSDVDRFFAAVEAGNWEEAERIYKTLRDGEYNGSPRSADLRKFWRPILEAYGAAEEVHSWPAQQLLDYGNSVLGSLRPGMVYVGGTDPGCFIPTMLNETTDGEQHIVFTQNALADSSYIDYVNFLYGDQVNILTADDNKSAFDQYSADAKKRLEHDQQFPDEPKQILPGEDLQMVNGSLIIHGVTAVMAINEVLLQDFLQKNPDLSVAMEESYPLKSTYAGAAPLGPIMELGANDGASAITADTAAQTAGYWDSAAQNLLSNPEAAASDTVLKTYSHEAVAAGNLLANNNYSDAAEQTYQTALDLWPDNPEAAYTFARFLAGQGRMDEAREILDTIVTDDPVQAAAVEAVRGTLKAAPGQPSRAVP